MLPAHISGPGPVGAERRASLRFPLELEVRYRVSEREPVKVSKTLNISSLGLLFSTEERLNSGQPLEMSLNWPVHLDAKFPLQLFIRGSVVRCDRKQAAVAIQRYEFRTQGARSLAQRI